MSPIPPNPDRAVTDLMDELYAQSMRPHRRIVRWCRRWLAYALVLLLGLPVLVWRAVRRAFVWWIWPHQRGRK